MNHAKLKAELADVKYAGMSVDEKLAALTVENIPQFKPVEYTHVASYLSVVKKLLAIVESPLESARMYMLASQTFKTFDLSNPVVAATINETLDSLISAGLLSALDKSAILELANDGLTSRAQELSLGRIRKGDVEYAETL